MCPNEITITQKDAGGTRHGHRRNQRSKRTTPRRPTGAHLHRWRVPRPPSELGRQPVRLLVRCKNSAIASRLTGSLGRNANVPSPRSVPVEMWFAANHAISL